MCLSTLWDRDTGEVVEDDYDLSALPFPILPDALFAFNKCCDPFGRILDHNISFFQYGLFLDTKLGAALHTM